MGLYNWFARLAPRFGRTWWVQPKLTSFFFVDGLMGMPVGIFGLVRTSFFALLQVIS